MKIQTEIPRRVLPHADILPETAEPSEPPMTRIRPPRGWQGINLRELWQARELGFFLVWRDVKIRYKQTALGAAWAVLQPLMMMIVFTIFFGRMAGMPSGDLPYPLFAFAGLLPWTFFACAIANGGNSVVMSERLITKIYFPRLAIPFASVGAALVDFLIAFAMLLVLMAWYGVAPGWGFLAAPVVLAVIVLAALAVGTTLAALQVAYRDFRYVIPFLVQVWLFATPTVYMQPNRGGGMGLATLLELNPMSVLIASFRAACLGGTIPWGPFAIATAAVVLAFVAGCLYFRRVEEGFADII
jgi:lipopolysaccharide transport system permease protein